MSNKRIEILGKTFASQGEAQIWYKDDLRKRLPELNKKCHVATGRNVTF